MGKLHMMITWNSTGLKYAGTETLTNQEMMEINTVTEMKDFLKCGQSVNFMLNRKDTASTRYT